MVTTGRPIDKLFFSVAIALFIATTIISAMPDIQIGLEGANDWGGSSDPRCRYDLTGSPDRSGWWTQPVSSGGGSFQATSAQPGEKNSGYPQCFRIYGKSTSPADILDKDFQVCYQLVGGNGEQCTPWASAGGGAGQPATSNVDARRVEVTVKTRPLDPYQSCIGASSISLSLNGGAPGGAQLFGGATNVFTTTYPDYVSWIHTGDGRNIRSMSMTLTASSCPPLVGVTSVEVNDSSPAPNSMVTLICTTTADMPAIRANANLSSITFTKAVQTLTQTNFTFNVTNRGDIYVNCTNGADTATTPGLVVVLSVAGAPTVTTKTLCQSGTVSGVNVTWVAIAGATKYNIYKNSTLAGSTTDLNWTAGGSTIVDGVSHNWSVAAVNTQSIEGPRGAKITTYSCQVPVNDYAQMPDEFQRAYFARKGQKRVAAYWTDPVSAIVFEQFTTNLTPLITNQAEGRNVTALPGSIQLILVDTSGANALAVWQQYTTSLRIS